MQDCINSDNTICRSRLSGVSLAGICLVLTLVLAPGTSATAVAQLPDFTELVKKVSPAVVHIKTSKPSRQLFRQFNGQGLPDFLRRLMPKRDQDQGDNPDPESSPDLPGEEQLQRGTGSGIVISADGYILTNNHVVDGATRLVVAFSDRREREAVVVGRDPLSDLALIKVEVDNLPVMEIGDSSALEPGQWVVAIGSPFDFEFSVSAGIVSAIGRSLPGQASSYVPFIQTDVAVNPGNSGGPLLDLNGRVVGINSQILTRSGGFIGISFAIPIDVAMEVVAQIKDGGNVSRGWLGVVCQSITSDLADAYGMDRAAGALINTVVSASPAEKAGLLVGDIIVSFNGTAIDLASDLPPVVGRADAGSEAVVEVIRDGELKQVTMTIGKLGEFSIGLAGEQGGEVNRLNIDVSDLTQADKQQADVTGGVKVRTLGKGPGQVAGIRPGDIITMIHSEWVTDAEQFEELIARLPGNRALPLRLIRDGQVGFRVIRIPE